MARTREILLGGTKFTIGALSIVQLEDRFDLIQQAYKITSTDGRKAARQLIGMALGRADKALDVDSFFAEQDATITELLDAVIAVSELAGLEPKKIPAPAAGEVQGAPVPVPAAPVDDNAEQPLTP